MGMRCLLALSAALAFFAAVQAILDPAGQAGTQPKSVAIIGGGVGAASAAHGLHSLLGDSVHIAVFEAEAELGGRAHSVSIDGATVELGASIIWHGNQYVRELAAVAGLKTKQPGPGGSSGASRLLAIYDGRELIFRESSWSLLTALRLFFRWGLAWWRFSSQPKAVAQQFGALYAALDAGTPWDSPGEMLEALGLRQLTEANLVEWLNDNYDPALDPFDKEVIAGVNLCNYNQQNIQLNAFAGLVSLLPATDGRVLAIEGGNQQLAGGVFDVVEAAVHTSAAVAGVTRLPGGGYRLVLRPGAAEAAQAAVDGAVFDAVVVAAPLEFAGLRFEGVELPRIPARKFQQTITTLVRGSVRPSYFGLDEMTFGSVLRTQDARVPWSSLSLVGVTAQNATLWKLFSPDQVPHAWLSIIFEGEFEVVAQRTWPAYPAFDPPEDFARWRLADGLVYLNAIENAASAMEMSAIAGRNGALLVAAHLRGNASAPDAAAAAAA